MAVPIGLLPAVGTLSYNGYTFNPATQMKVGVTFVYDDADRTVKGCKYLFDVLTWVGDPNANNQDSDLATIRKQLSKPGQQFSFSGRGFGDLTVNQSYGGKRDIAWGPKPRELEWSPLGPKAARLRWRMEVFVPECTNAAYTNQLMAFNYSVTFEIDEEGYSTRTLKGYLEIPVTRTPDGGRSVLDNADRYRERVQVPLLPGFRRKPGVFTESADRRRLDFVVVDEQLPAGAGLPQYCMTATGEHDVRNDPGNLARWQATLSASYVVSPTQPKARAWEAFFALLSDRIEATRQAAQAAGDGADGVVLHSFRAREGLYLAARSVGFEVQYTFTARLVDLFLASGQWRPVPGTDWQRWAQTVSDVIGPRGAAGLRSSASADAIIDLCGTRPTQAPAPANQFRPGYSTGAPRQQAGYLAYVCTLELEQRTNVLTHRSLLTTGNTAQEKPPSQQTQLRAGLNPEDVPSLQTTDDTSDGNPLGGLQGILQDVLNSATREAQGPLPPPRPNSGGRIAPDSPRPPSAKGLAVDPGSSGRLEKRPAPVQQRSDSEWVARLRGYAVRCGAPPELPDLTELAGAKCYCTLRKVNQRVLGRLGDQVLFYADWILEYELTLPPGQGKIGVPYPPNLPDPKKSVYT